MLLVCPVQVLVLVELLHSVTSIFDRYRAVRYQQSLGRELQQHRKLPQVGGCATRGTHTALLLSNVTACSQAAVGSTAITLHSTWLQMQTAVGTAMALHSTWLQMQTAVGTAPDTQQPGTVAG